MFGRWDFCGRRGHLPIRSSSTGPGPTAKPEPPMATGAYTVYDNSWHEEHDRLALLEAWLDPWTTSQLDALGITTGWSCLEAGAGGGSIAEWLCTRVGVEGHVLATDIDTRFVGALRHPSLEVQPHDISADELPTGRFDLVHARLLL